MKYHKTSCAGGRHNMPRPLLTLKLVTQVLSTTYTGMVDYNCIKPVAGKNTQQAWALVRVSGERELSLERE